MISSHWLIFYTALYLGILFYIAYHNDQLPRGQYSRFQPVIYTLSLTVYCTSWTFFGAVGNAAGSGWDFFSIYLGPIIVFVFFFPFLQKLIDTGKRHKTTSIADFIATRYGKSNLLAAVVTIIALIGILPYISLQIKAIANAYDLLTGINSNITQNKSVINTALVLSLILAIFSILFGARNIDASEHHRGMIHAISFESVIKLLAFLAIAVLALNTLISLTETLDTKNSWQLMTEHFSNKELTSSFLVKTLLAATAVICLPRQFHVTAVEARGDELPIARWGFPIYLLLFSAAVIPITTAGLAMTTSPMNADLYVLTLPLNQGNTLLAVISYIGGFSAATGMVIVSTIALSTMTSNDLIFPLLVRLQKNKESGNLYPKLLIVRRATIIVLLLLAYGYYELAGSGKSLYSIGLLSFAASAQFMPALVGALYWRRGHRNGALAGLLIGFIIWLYTLLLPSLANSAWLPNEFATSGILGIEWLKPHALFGITFNDTLTHGVFWSLLFNISGYIIFSIYARHSFTDQLQANTYVDHDESLTHDTRKIHWNLRISDLYELCSRFTGEERTYQFFKESGYDLESHTSRKVDAHILRKSERFLASTIGTATAEHLFRTVLAKESSVSQDLYQWLDKTSQALQFNREILQVTLDNINQGVSVVDKQLKLVAWNRLYIELFGYKDDHVYVGKPIEEIIRFNTERGLFVTDQIDNEAEIQKRLNYLKHGSSYTHVRQWNDGRVIQTQGARMPDGGFITTFTDISILKQVEQQLEETNQNLENKIHERTRMLSEVNKQLSTAKLIAESTTRSKTHFLALASHDLTQPLSASKLYISALLEDVIHENDIEKENLAKNALSALTTAESLLKTLLGISKLDSGSLRPEITRFPIQQIFKSIDNEFSVLAAEKNLKLHVVSTQLGTKSDLTLLRSILQNFVSNAVRYTQRGTIMICCRREGEHIRIEVRDSGIGIPKEKSAEIFHEFHQLDKNSEGAGLGLAICQRMANLLRHDIKVRSYPGQGSCFSITVPRCEAEVAATAATQDYQSYQRRWLENIRILCVDDDKEILKATHTLLERWGGIITCQQDASEFPRYTNDDNCFNVVLMDYQLNDNLCGLDLLKQYKAHFKEDFLGIIVTAEQDPEIEINTLQSGFKYLAKPVEPAKLRATLQAAFMDRRLAAKTAF